MLSRLIGFRQSLLLLVVITALGFSILTGTSLLGFENQASSSQQVDRANSQLLTLERLRGAVLAIPMGDTSQVDIEAVRQQMLPLLEQLHSESQTQSAGVELGGELGGQLDRWLNDYSSMQAGQQALGLSAEQGLRVELLDAMDYLSSSLHSHMIGKYRSFEDAVAPMFSSLTQETAEAAMTEYQSFDTFVDYIGMREDFDDLLVDTRAALESATGAVVQFDQARIQARTELSALLSLISRDQEYLENALAAANLESTSMISETRSQLVSVALSVLIVSGMILLWIWRKATGTLGSTVKTLEQIAAGDLTRTLPENPGSQDDFDRLGKAVNDLTRELSAILAQVQRTSESLTTQSSELNQSASDQTRASAKTEQDVREVSDAVMEISSTVSQMAAAVEETNQLSGDAREATNKGGAVITNALGSMEALSKTFGTLRTQLDGLDASSKKVDGVTAMIGGLAEQTNLLALNAAIESARAGEAGRGFSVVADEVRALAEKTVSATSSINQTIQEMQTQLKQLLGTMKDSQSQIDQSRAQGDDAIAEMDRISELFSQVNERNQQQSSSIDHIASTSRSNADSLSKVVARVTEGTKGLQDVRQFAGDVNRQAEDLTGQAKKFRCE